MKDEMNSKSKPQFILSKVLFLLGTVSLIISIIQLSNSSLNYGILSLFYTGIFWIGGMHNKILVNLKLDGHHKTFNKIIFTSLMLGMFIGGACTYIIYTFVI